MWDQMKQDISKNRTQTNSFIVTGQNQNKDVWVQLQVSVQPTERRGTKLEDPGTSKPCCLWGALRGLAVVWQWHLLLGMTAAAWGGGWSRNVWSRLTHVFLQKANLQQHNWSETWEDTEASNTRCSSPATCCGWVSSSDQRTVNFTKAAAPRWGQTSATWQEEDGLRASLYFLLFTPETTQSSDWTQRKHFTVMNESSRDVVICVLLRWKDRASFSQKL